MTISKVHYDGAANFPNEAINIPISTFSHLSATPNSPYPHTPFVITDQILLFNSSNLNSFFSKYTWKFDLKNQIYGTVLKLPK